MWKVFFNSVEVFTSKSDVEAIQFAISLHQASNVPHGIDVYSTSEDEDGQDVIVCMLCRK